MSRDFPGAATDYLNIGDPAATDITGSDITVACWVQFDAVALEQGLVTKWGGTTATRTYALELLSSRIDFAVSNSSTTTTLCQGATTVVAGRWYHFCGVQNSTDVFAYLNGAQDGTNATNVTLVNIATELQLGKFAVANLPLDGRLAEVAIWAAPLSAAEVAQLAGGASPLSLQAAGLRGYWPLCGDQLPEPDLKNGNQAAQVGTVPGGADPFSGGYCGGTAVPTRMGFPRFIR